MDNTIYIDRLSFVEITVKIPNDLAEYKKQIQDIASEFGLILTKEYSTDPFSYNAVGMYLETPSFCMVFRASSDQTADDFEYDLESRLGLFDPNSKSRKRIFRSLE